MHGRQKNRCKECGGTGICIHRREKAVCKGKYMYITCIISTCIRMVRFYTETVEKMCGALSLVNLRGVALRAPLPDGHARATWRREIRESRTVPGGLATWRPASVTLGRSDGMTYTVSPTAYVNTSGEILIWLGASGGAGAPAGAGVFANGSYTFFITGSFALS